MITVTTKQTTQPKAAPLNIPGYTTVNRELILKLSASVPYSLTNDAIQQAVNTALTFTIIKIVFVSRTRKANPSLFTNSDIEASLLKSYFESISFAPGPLRLEVSTIRINLRWSKFILRGVPTHVRKGPEAGLRVAAGIKETYPPIILCQSPRWLSRPATHQSKTQFLMVCVVPGNWTVFTFRIRSLILFHTSGRFEFYLTINSDTQCRKWQAFDHHEKRCELSPVCSICAAAHTFSSYKCIDVYCKGGYKCTHPPIKCANGLHSLGHKASHDTCPAHARLQS